MARKAKRLTKRGQPKTGATPGSDTRRSEGTRAGATSRRDGRSGARGRTASAGRGQTTGPALALASRQRRRRREAPPNVRNKATSAAKAGQVPARGRPARNGGRLASRSRSTPRVTGGGGPEIALRDLLRGGLPRSAKAPRAAGGGAPSGRVKRGTRAAHGMKKGATLMQAKPRHREFVGVIKPGIPKR